jgi:hypothetical protein
MFSSVSPLPPGPVALFALAVSSVALAEPGDHVRVGDVEIVPELDVGFEYRSNVYHEEVDPQAGGNLRVAPRVGVNAQGEDHQFSFAGEYEARKQLFLTFDPASVPPALAESLDRQVATNNLNRWSDFTADARANLFRQSMVGFEVSDAATYRNNVIDSDFTDSPYMTTFRNKLLGGMRFRPSGAVEIKAGGAWQYDDYRVPEFFTFAELDPNEHDPFNSRNTYGPQADLVWSFFPNTALVFEASYQWLDWRVEQVSSLLTDPTGGALLDPINKADSTQLRLQGGLRGRISQKLRTDLLVGYGQGRYEDLDPTSAVDTSGLQNFLVTAQLGYLIRPGSQMAIGYRRDFADVFFTNYLSSDFFYLQGETKVSRVELAARYGLRLERYRGPVSRDDVFGRGAIEGRLLLSDWAKLMGSVLYQSRFSSDDLVEYDDLGLMVGASVLY